jgi:AcrR family transcriptional regulator
MSTNTISALEPRKTPIQARSTVTVEAISEATIQVLLSHGADRLTTTRVADRAGVSVGTLYQYYPNEQALRFSVVEGHTNKVSQAVETACADACHRPMSEMIRRVVEVFVDIKMQRADIFIALYKVAPDVGGPALVKRPGQRLRKAIKAMLLTAPDLKLSPERFAIDMMLSAMSGARRSALEAGALPTMFRKVREHLVLLCQSYMAATTDKDHPGLARIEEVSAYSAHGSLFSGLRTGAGGKAEIHDSPENGHEYPLCHSRNRHRQLLLVIS